MQSSASKPRSIQTWVPQVSILRPGILRYLSLVICITTMILCAHSAVAQTAAQAWLKYRPLGKPLSIPMRVVTLGQSLLEQTAAIELRRGLLSLSGGYPLEVGPNMILLATVQEMRAHQHQAATPSLESDEFLITTRRDDLIREIDIIGGSDRAILYGAFALLRDLAQGLDMSKVNLRERPAMPIRWVDEWDNIDGSIERGYAGRSIFFDAGHVRDRPRPRQLNTRASSPPSASTAATSTT